MKKLLKYFIIFTLPLSTISIFSQELKLEITKLIESSPIVVLANVEKTDANWITDERGKHIYTTATLHTKQIIKGIINEVFKIQVVGGKVGDITQFVSHSVSFHTNEEVILFLDSDPLRVFGGSQGKILICDGKVYFGKNDFLVENFIQAIKEYIANPKLGFRINEDNSKIREFKYKESKDNGTINQDLETTKEHPPLKVDPNSPQQKVTPSESKESEHPQIKVVPGSEENKTQQEISKPKEHPPLKVDPNSPHQKVTPSEPKESEYPQIKVVPGSEENKTQQEISKPKEHPPLKVDPNSPQ